jgi:hypothetical protein
LSMPKIPSRKTKESGKIEDGGMAEWLKAAVLKTVNGVTRSGVRIPLPPPDIELTPQMAGSRELIDRESRWRPGTVGQIRSSLDCY